MLKTPAMKQVKAAAHPPTTAQRVASTSLLQSRATNLPRAVRAAASTLARSATQRTGLAPAGTRPATPVAPGKVPAIVPGAMPRKVFVSPKVAVPPRPRAPGAAKNIPGVFDRLTRGRIQQRSTR